MAELEASAASISTADRVDDVACRGDANQPPPAGAVHDAALARQIRSTTCGDQLDDRAPGEGPSASIESSSDATTSTACLRCIGNRNVGKHTCGKARNAPPVLAAPPARASRRSRSDAEPVTDQPASRAARLSMEHASAYNAHDDGTSQSSSGPIARSPSDPTGPHDVEMQGAEVGSPGVAPSGSALNHAWETASTSPEEAFQALASALFDVITARLLDDEHFGVAFDALCAGYDTGFHGARNGQSALKRLLRRLSSDQTKKGPHAQEWATVYQRWRTGGVAGVGSALHLAMLFCYTVNATPIFLALRLDVRSPTSRLPEFHVLLNTALRQLPPVFVTEPLLRGMGPAEELAWMNGLQLRDMDLLSCTTESKSADSFASKSRGRVVPIEILPGVSFCSLASVTCAHAHEGEIVLVPTEGLCAQPSTIVVGGESQLAGITFSVVRDESMDGEFGMG